MVTTYRERFESAVDAAVNGVTVLTLNTRSARAIYAGAETRLRETGTAWLAPDVLPFGAFVERLYSEAVVCGAATRKVLQREQELQLWRQIIERSPAGRELLLIDSAADLAAQAFRTACEYEIGLDSPQMGLSSDTRAFAGWAADFRRELAERRCISAALLTRELSGCIAKLRIPARLLIFSSELTAEQRRFLGALAKIGVGVTLAFEAGARQCEATAASSVRHEFASAEDELRCAAQWARRRLEDDPALRLGVVIFDLDRRASEVESIFRSVFHPEHLLGKAAPEAFEIASPRALIDYPLAACAVGLLSLFAGPVAFESFEATLRAPYLTLPSEAVARFLSGVRKHAGRQVSLEEFVRWVRERNELPQLRAPLARWTEQVAFSGVQHVGFWAKVARELLQAFGWPGQIALNSEEFQCIQSWSNLLAEIVSLELLDWRCDFRGFVSRMQRALASRNFKPETLNAPVQIMDVAEFQGSVFDALWIAGCSDDRWPDSPRSTPLIPLPLLRAAGVPVASTPAADERIARMTSLLLQSAPQITLSLALRVEEDREQRWSPLFSHIPLTGETMRLDPELGERFAPVAMEIVADHSAPALHASECVRGGTSLLQEQSNCPFRAFAIRRLLAGDQEGPNEALAPNERGKIIDHALQLIWEQLHNSDGLAHPERAEIVAAAVDKAMKSELPHRGDAWTARFRALERQRTIEVIEEWLALEARRPSFRVVGHQIPIEAELAGLPLRGRLDRLDEVGGAHIIVDYKTGAADSVRSWRIPRPERPQLPFYAWAMQREYDVGGISFAAVRRGECAFRGYLRDKDLLPCTDATRSFDGMSFDEYARLWAEELERIASAFVQGEAGVEPKLPPGKNQSPCTHCHLPALCRVQDIAGEGGSEEEESDE